MSVVISLYNEYIMLGTILMRMAKLPDNTMSALFVGWYVMTNLL